MAVNKIALTFAAVAALAVQPAASETLEEVLQRVYETNPNIQAERARQRATSEATSQAWAGALPQISASAGYSRIDEEQTVSSTFFGQTTTNSAEFKLDTKTLAISAEQVLFDGRRTRSLIELARARVRAGEAQLMRVEQETLLAAVTAYFDVQRDMTVYETTAANVDVLTEQQREAQLRFKYGEVTQTDVRQADARLAGARAQLAAARTQLAVSRAAFQEVVGDAPGELEEATGLPSLPADEQAAQAFGRNAAPAIIAAQQEAEASGKQVRVQNSAFSPRISAVASYNYAEDPSSFIQQDEQFAYGLRATVPLFQGGQRFSQRREAKAFHARDKLRVVAVERSVKSQIIAAWRQLIEAKTRIMSAETQVEANEIALNGVRREAQVGTRTTLDVLNAEQELLNSHVSLATAKRDEQVSAYRLLSAIGALTPDALAAPPLATGWTPEPSEIVETVAPAGEITDE